MSYPFRSTSYTCDEDRHLCRVWLEISQDSLYGNNQTGLQLWKRIEIQYHSEPQFSNPHRPESSLHKRFNLIRSATSKFKGCVRQVELQNPSGASEQDIMNRAKVLFALDPKYSKGFKFEHVWDIMKNVKKFGTDEQTDKGFPPSNSSGQEMHEAECSFDLNITDSDSGSNAAKRPLGVKKAKLKKKGEDNMENFLKQQHAIVNELKAGNMLLKEKEENKILLKNLNSISDPIMREYIHGEQIKIMQRRMQASGSQSSSNPSSGSQTFSHQGGGSQSFPYEENDSQFNQAQEEGQGSQNLFNNVGNYNAYFGSDLGPY